MINLKNVIEKLALRYDPEYSVQQSTMTNDQLKNLANKQYDLAQKGKPNLLSIIKREQLRRTKGGLPDLDLHHLVPLSEITHNQRLGLMDTFYNKAQEGIRTKDLDVNLKRFHQRNFLEFVKNLRTTKFKL